MAMRTELSLRLQNSLGVLSHICQHLSEERVNILALNLEAGGTLRLVVDNPLRAGVGGARYRPVALRYVLRVAKRGGWRVTEPRVAGQSEGRLGSAPPHQARCSSLRSNGL